MDLQVFKSHMDLSQPSIKLAVLGMACIGAFKIAKTALVSANAVAKYLVWPRKDLSSRYGKGSWALITGASNGLGREYAFELAREGFNIILMGRNQAKTD